MTTPRQSERSAHGPTDIDRLARQALKERQEKPDLLKIGFPFEPGGWHIIVEPIAPRSVTDGGIEIVEDAQNAESFLATIGRVLKVGPSCMEGTTPSGIKLSNFRPDIQKGEDLIGRYVLYQLHTGHELKLRASGLKLRILKVTDLLGVTDEPNAWRFYI